VIHGIKTDNPDTAHPFVLVAHLESIRNGVQELQRIQTLRELLERYVNRETA
jgi:hypothetical protein